MIWLIGMTTLLVLGWGFTITRLLYDERRVKRDSHSSAKTIQWENRPGFASDWAQADPRGV